MSWNFNRLPKKVGTLQKWCGFFISATVLSSYWFIGPYAKYAYSMQTKKNIEKRSDQIVFSTSSLSTNSPNYKSIEMVIDSIWSGDVSEPQPTDSSPISHICIPLLRALYEFILNFWAICSSSLNILLIVILNFLHSPVFSSSSLFSLITIIVAFNCRAWII